VNGSRSRDPISGLCGRVAKPPPEAVLDELSAILLEEGWPNTGLPNISQAWLDVSPDDCIAHPQDCIEKWNLVGAIGLGFSGVTVLCTMWACVLDCVVDRRIRERSFFEDVQKVTAPKSFA